MRLEFDSMPSTLENLICQDGTAPQAASSLTIQDSVWQMCS
jgi:hypothetical protein